MFDFIDGIIKKSNIGLNEPFLEDKYEGIKNTSMKIMNNSTTEVFFKLLRMKINELINKYSRAPHYLIHGVNRMTKGSSYLIII